MNNLKGISVQEMLKLPQFQKAQVLAGSDLGSRMLFGAHVIEASESYTWMRPGDMIFTSGVAFKDQGKDISAIIQNISGSGAVGLVLEEGKYIKNISESCVKLAKTLGVVLLTIPFKVMVSDVIAQIYYLLFQKNAQVQSMQDVMEKLIYGREPVDVQTLADFSFHPEKKHLGVVVGIASQADREMTDREMKLLSNAVHNTADSRQNVMLYEDRGGLSLRMEMIQQDSVRKTAEDLCGKIQAYVAKTDPDIRVCLGAGSSFKGADRIQEGLKEARQAFRMIQVCRVDGGIRYYHDLGIYRIFFSLPDKSVLDGIYEDTLGKLKEYDESTGSDLVQTLRIYLEERNSILETAKRLYVHRNTVKYRIGRIEEILGYELCDGNEEFRLRLAFKIKKFRGL